MAFKVNLTGITDDGYTVLPPGRYNVETDEWFAKTKEETGNLVFRVMLVVQDGEYEGEKAAYFQTLIADGAPDKLRTNRRFLLRLLNSIGVIVPEDQKEELQVEFAFEEPDDESEWVGVKAVVVNGETREVSGRKAVAVNVIDNHPSNTSGVRIERLEPPVAPAGKAPTDTKDKSKKGKLPF